MNENQVNFEKLYKQLVKIELQVYLRFIRYSNATFSNSLNYINNPEYFGEDILKSNIEKLHGFYGNCLSDNNKKELKKIESELENIGR